MCVRADVWHLGQVFACTGTRNPLGACPAFCLFARPYGYSGLARALWDYAAVVH